MAGLATQYLRAHYNELGNAADWRENFDVVALAKMMGVLKDGPSTGATIVTGIVSALKGVQARHDIAMTSEIAIMGRVLPVGGIQPKVRAAYEAGVKEELLPADNLKEAQSLPDYIVQALTLTPVTSIQDVLERALLGEP